MTDRGAQVIYFLDIQIKGSDQRGFEVAEEVRKRDPYATIVFVTTHTEFLPITFQYKVAALDFIDKNLDEKSYRQKLEAVIEVVLTKETCYMSDDAFKAEFATMAIQIPFNKILFFETSHTVHKIILHTIDEQIEFYGQLSKVAKSEPRLFKSHKSYVINPRNITRIDKETGVVHFVNGETCLVAKTKQKQLIRMMSIN